LIEPEVMIDEKVMTIPGTDGQKMSKSYNNFINIFLPDKKLRKQIMSIETSSTAMEEPKETKDCNVFNLYNLLASEADSAQMKANYEGGNYGYGHAKQALFELITKKYTVERTRFNELMNNQSLIEEELQKGAVKARKIAEDVLQRVRTKVGY
ncbi:MAG: tryptophan--tRNA ligase, partial [Flavobacteriales bacterium]|nr:tryptophan--tRNA ligase [Flavobacteriales bacterium]